METTHDEVMQKVFELRNTFYREYGIKPNAVYLGNEQYYAAKKGPKLNVTMDYLKGFTIFGLEGKRVTDDNYISVGLIAKDWNNNEMAE